jgi:Ca-activated chloride channel family protein
MPSFDHPLLLVLALLAPLGAVLLLRVAHKRRLSRLLRLADSMLLNRLAPGAATRSPRRRVAIIAIAVSLAAVAAAGPRWGRDESRVFASGIDIVLALDASLSMLATDERPTRLERMKLEVRRLRATASGDRIGVIAFAGRSYILTPLTADDGALDLFIDNLDPSIVGQAGSAVSRAITQGTELLLATESASEKALIVMSDWESFDSRDQTIAAARRVRDAGINFVAVGFGSSGGSSIPLASDAGTTAKLDEAGNVVITRFDSELMRSAATAAGGAVVDAAEGDKAARIRRVLSSLQDTRRELRRGTELAPRFQLFLLPALLLVLLDILISEGIWRRGRDTWRRTSLRRGAAALAVVVIIQPGATSRLPLDTTAGSRASREESIAGLRARIARGDHSEKAFYNLGTALLLSDSLTAAVEALAHAARSADSELRYNALFNVGLAQLRAGLSGNGSIRENALSAAREAYRNAMLLRPGDRDAKWNYELALRFEGGSGGGGGMTPNQMRAESAAMSESPRSEESSGIGRQQAEQILDNAARDERDVQARAQRRNRPTRPPGGKDW